jgi:hypothetical protein
MAARDAHNVEVVGSIPTGGIPVKARSGWPDGIKVTGWDVKREGARVIFIVDEFRTR